MKLKLSNEEWVEQIQSTNPIALNNLTSYLTGFLVNRFERYSSEFPIDLVRFCEDIAQDTIIFIYQNTHRYEFRSSFPSWCCSVAKNKAIERLRLTEFASTIDLVEDYTDLAFELNDNHAESRLDYLKKMILQLSPRHRFVIEQYYLYYSTPEQIAFELDINLNAYYQLLNRALNNLRSLVRQDNELRRQSH